MTTTTYLEWDDQATGANNNTWGDVTDANLTILELAIARFLSIATTGGTTTLTSAQNRYPIIRLTGVLASNAIIEVRTAEKNWRFINATTGAFTVTVKTSAGTGKTLPRGRAVMLYCDGTNVEHARATGIPSAQAGGTVDALTATFEPATATAELQDGTMFFVEAAGANTTTTPTFSPDGLTARTITKNGGQALVAGDIRGAGHKLLLSYDESSTRYELLNPALVAASTTAIGISRLATTAETQAMASAVLGVTPAGLAALLGQGTDVAGAATISLPDGGYFNITGTSFTCTDIDFTTASLDGRSACLYFVSAGGILTHNATTMPLPGAANITIEAGDLLLLWQDAGDNIKTMYFRASGRPVVPSSMTLLGSIDTSTGASASLGSLVLTGYKALRLVVNGLSGVSATNFLIGTSTSDDVRFTADLDAAGSLLRGILDIDLTTGIGKGTLIDSNNSQSTSRAFASTITTAATAISIAGASGNLDGGAIAVYGVA